MSENEHKIKIKVQKKADKKLPQEAAPAAPPVSKHTLVSKQRSESEKVSVTPHVPSALAPLKVPTIKERLLVQMQIASSFLKGSVQRVTKTKNNAPQKKKPPLALFQGFSTKELVHFAKRLAFLIKSGVPILESLHLLRKQTRSRARGRVLDAVIEDVSNGRFLSTGLARFRGIFGDFTINLVRVGEMSGTLSSNLTYLSVELEKRNALKRKVIGALVYPAFITVATIGITTLLTVYIFPKVMPIFISLNVTLPFTTKVLLFTSNFLRHFGLYVLAGLTALVIAYFFALRKSEKLHYFISRNVLRAPLFGTLVQNYNMANFCRTLSLLLQSGFNVVEAATVTGDSTSNPVYKRECIQLRECIIKGERISGHLEKNQKLFPDMVCHMITIGEKSGTLSETLMYLAEHYEAEVDDTIKNLSSSIEPVLMVFMGIVVGFVAVSVITPIYDITQHLSK